MSNWSWLDETPTSSLFLGRVIVKALLLFGLCNLSFAWIYPMEWLGQFSLYGQLYPTRPRLPYGENPSQSYNVSLDNLPALFASHTISQSKNDDEYRVLLIGDSNTWGWLLDNDQTLAAHLNSADLHINQRSVVAYNLGYPVMSLTKDVLILDEALTYEPDMIIWLVSLASFPPEQQFLPPLVQNNQHRLQIFSDTLNLDRYSADVPASERSFLQRTIIGERRALADLLRLQTYGIAWSATGIDQIIPENISLRQSDFTDDLSWSIFDEPTTTLSIDTLAFDVLTAGINHVGNIPIIIINEPMFISDGINSERRYNSFYPRWAYDQYRDILQSAATQQQWQYYDLWDTIPPNEFTDSPVHLSAAGTQALAQMIIETIFNSED